jgi:hypothetical protein
VNGLSGWRSIHGDERGIITGFIVRTIVVLALLALVIEEGGQVIAAQIKAQSVSRAAAQAGADAWHRTHDFRRAKLAAVTAAEAVDNEAALTSFTIGEDGSATATAEVVAHTVAVKRVSFLRRFGVQKASDTETFSPF